MEHCRTVGQKGIAELELVVWDLKQEYFGRAEKKRKKGILEGASVFLFVVGEVQLACDCAGGVDPEEGMSLGLVIMFFSRERLLKFLGLKISHSEVLSTSCCRNP